MSWRSAASDLRKFIKVKSVGRAQEGKSMKLLLSLLFLLLLLLQLLLRGGGLPLSSAR